MSALGQLFTDIASAIRGKTGETETMKPAEFPDKIASITTGGSTSGTGWHAAKGEFTPTTKLFTIEHNLGVIPDIFFVIKTRNFTPQSVLTGFVYIGFSERLYNMLQDNSGKVAGTSAFVQISPYDSSELNINTLNPNNIEEQRIDGDIFGLLKDCTTSTITIGTKTSSSWILALNEPYVWGALWCDGDL